MQTDRSKQLRVLEVIRQGEVGGGESHVIDLVMGLRERGDFLPIILAFTDGPMMYQLRDSGFRCYVVNTRHAFDPRVMSRIKEIIECEHIGLIHAHGSRAASNMLVVARRTHIPMVYTVHGWSFHEGQCAISFTLRRMSEWCLCRAAQRVICVSESNRKTGIRTFGLLPDKCTVIENGINLNRFNPDATYPDVRSELGFAPDDFVILYCCRITAQKAPMDFVHAVEQAHNQNEHIRALMVGEGDMAADVDTYIKDHAREDIIVRQPFRQDVPALLASADLFCLPSLWEGLSIAMLEAMAMRIPMVVTLTDGARDLLRQHQNAFIVPVSRPDVLAQTFCEAASDPALCKKLGHRAQQLIRQRFDAARVTEQVAHIYHELKP